MADNKLTAIRQALFFYKFCRQHVNQNGFMSQCKILVIAYDQYDIEILCDAFRQSGVELVKYVFSAQAIIYVQAFSKTAFAV